MYKVKKIRNLEEENQRLRKALIIMGKIAKSAVNMYEVTDEKLASLRRQILNYLDQKASCKHLARD